MSPLFLLLILLCPVPSWAADLTIDVQTVPGAETTEVQVIGGGVPLDDPRALYRTLTQGDLSVKILGTTIEKAFPGTDYLCLTARKKGMTQWFTYPDGTLRCIRWPTTVVVQPPVEPPPVEPPPIEPPPVTPVQGITRAELDVILAARDAVLATQLAKLRSEMDADMASRIAAAIQANDQLAVDALNVCLSKRNPNALTCVRALSEALKKVNP